MCKILAFSGSARKGSFNQQLVSIAARGAEAAGAEVTLINLVDFPMPIFNQDLESEQGMPENGQRLKTLLTEHDGLLIASPEHNSSYSSLLKNAIDWASRATSADEVPLSAFQGKYATIMAASPGGLGGLRGLVTLRMLLANIGVTVLPKQIAISQAFSAFEQGKLVDETKHNEVRAMGENLRNLLQKLKES
ncbi:NADPH-dependent FMN reductase [Thalassotalea sp. ND16A]|uniref:NADPH-dependent FMN reductase n=1 Tax=Thalassotalea sp. ND16A TaxID=1535422 RepID=UPI00051A5661|nr:NAD(P)H-dependent oxidoreductase [Thalassotalea sp. ND16A]KGJ98142.1 hypothetical protein ND16A_0947 [Thalassotalea sp. ND16A]